MAKLVYAHHWGGEPCGGTNYIPFEYESADDFVYFIHEKFKDFVWEYYGNGRDKYVSNSVHIFDNVYLTRGELDDIEHNVITLEEWFETQKENI